MKVMTMETVASPKELVLQQGGRSTKEWEEQQERLLNERYPGRNLNCQYHESLGKMYVVQNNGNDGPTIPIAEWLEKNPLQ